MWGKKRLFFFFHFQSPTTLLRLKLSGTMASIFQDQYEDTDPTPGKHSSAKSAKSDKKHTSHASNASASAPLSATLSTAPTSVGPPETHVSFTSVPALFSYLGGIGHDVDSVAVAHVTPSGFAAIHQAFQARGRKVRLMFLAEHEVAIITLPTLHHERLHLRLYSNIQQQIDQMGLDRAWDSTGATTFPLGITPGSSSQVEGDSGGKPFTDNAGDHNHGWPTIVIQGGFTQSIESLRAKMIFWFAASAHSVKIVVLAKAFPQQKRILVEQWQERGMPVSAARPGATMTRAAATSQSAVLQQPVCIQTINVVWAVPGVTYEDASPAQRRDPLSFNVVRGPLRLEFSRLFLREPAGLHEHDVVLQDDDLQWYAMRVWDE